MTNNKINKYEYISNNKKDILHPDFLCKSYNFINDNKINEYDVNKCNYKDYKKYNIDNISNLNNTNNIDKYYINKTEINTEINTEEINKDCNDKIELTIDRGDKKIAINELTLTQINDIMCNKNIYTDNSHFYKKNIPLININSNNEKNNDEENNNKENNDKKNKIINDVFTLHDSLNDIFNKDINDITFNYNSDFINSEIINNDFINNFSTSSIINTNNIKEEEKNNNNNISDNNCIFNSNMLTNNISIKNCTFPIINDTSDNNSDSNSNDNKNDIMYYSNINKWEYKYPNMNECFNMNSHSSIYNISLTDTNTNTNINTTTNIIKDCNDEVSYTIFTIKDDTNVDINANKNNDINNINTSNILKFENIILNNSLLPNNSLSANNYINCFENNSKNSSENSFENDSLFKNTYFSLNTSDLDNFDENNSSNFIKNEVPFTIKFDIKNELRHKLINWQTDNTHEQKFILQLLRAVENKQNTISREFFMKLYDLFYSIYRQVK